MRHLSFLARNRSCGFRELFYVIAYLRLEGIDFMCRNLGSILLGQSVEPSQIFQKARNGGMLLKPTRHPNVAM